MNPLTTPLLSSAEAHSRLQRQRETERGRYLAFYSSWMGGIVRDPELMTVPVDDHLVHRGDGVFEAFKGLGRKIYALEPHLDRLDLSMASIGLIARWTREQLRACILDTIRAAGADDVLVRLYVSRGPGGFTVNPRESIGPQLYIVVTKFDPVAPVRYERGVKAGLSSVPVKDPFFARVKSCNYLPNVLMKKEALDRELDFTLTVDADGRVGEGATENFGLVTEEGELVFPTLERVLRGVTLVRLLEIARPLVSEGYLQAIRVRDVHTDELPRAREMMLVGTTLDVVPVAEFEGRPVGSGGVGPVARRCRELLTADIHACAQMQTPF
jgi:4-amino-4-deoxychorismate lyase